MTKATETWQKFRNCRIQDDGRTPYWKSFLAITRLHVVRLRRNLEFIGIIARIQRLGDENVKFRKYNSADGRHFENRYISLYQPRIVRIWWNLVCRRKFWPSRRKRAKMSEIAKFKMADGRRTENHFLAITQLHIVSVRWNLEWGGRITGIRSRSGDQSDLRKSTIVDVNILRMDITSIYLSRESSIFDEIWYTNANFDTAEEICSSDINIKRAKYNFLN